MPRRPRTAAAGLLIFALVATLAGCSDTTRIPDPTPEATADPLFAADEEALAAAVEVYERYLVAADQFASGEADLQAVEGIASGPVLEEAVETEARFEADGLTLVGTRTVETARIQSTFVNGPSTEVTIYVCESVEGTDLLDSSGASLVSPDRDPLTDWTATLTFERDNSAGLVTEREFWDAGGVCV